METKRRSQRKTFTFLPDLINWGKWDMGKLGIVVLE